MANNIHPSAIIASDAEIGVDCTIGPYCLVDGDIVIGDRSIIESHAVITGKTVLGRNCHVFPFASIGHRPQDLKFAGELSSLEIGDNNTFREGVTINPGTSGGGMITRIGHNCLFMANSHVAHDCSIGDGVILANNVALGGHCQIDDHVIIGGLSAVHQFVRIGSHALVGGMTGVERDVIPFGLVLGNRANLVGLNLIGLRRSDFSREQIKNLQSAYDKLFASGVSQSLTKCAKSLKQSYSSFKLAAKLIDFILAPSKRSLCLQASEQLEASNRRAHSRAKPL